MGKVKKNKFQKKSTFTKLHINSILGFFDCENKAAHSSAFLRICPHFGTPARTHFSEIIKNPHF